MIKSPNLIGQKFGRLTVLHEHNCDRPGRHWVCSCECGNECIRRTGALQDKSTSLKSCGCARKESMARAAVAGWEATTKFRHEHKDKLKTMLSNMIRRCYTPTTRRYERYGGRGIQVCDEWRNNHTSFFEWAVANGYRPGLTIERNDVNGNYEPGNCRFATMVEQQNNTSRNRFLEWNGKRQTVSQWARELNVESKAIQHRVARGWPVERIFTQPFRGN